MLLANLKCLGNLGLFDCNWLHFILQFRRYTYEKEFLSAQIILF